MRDAFEIGNRSIESAAISQAALHVGPAADGRNREIPLLVCHGATEGPILWINGATHGDEPEGAFSIFRLLINSILRRYQGRSSESQP